MALMFLCRRYSALHPRQPKGSSDGGHWAKVPSASGALEPVRIAEARRRHGDRHADFLATSTHSRWKCSFGLC